MTDALIVDNYDDDNNNNNLQPLLAKLQEAW
jgi:hypothetical protein